MNKHGMTDKHRTGYIHMAMSVGIREKADELTARLKSDGYKVESGSRLTVDGYYESNVIAIESN